MTDSWISYLNSIESEIARIERTSDLVCFRGQAESSWELRPSLFVKQIKNFLDDSEITTKETALFFDFVTNAGPLLKNNISDWEILFEMRHHGIPTRLLDWTENFGTALYFALYGGGKNPTIWIMDCYRLNSITWKSDTIPNPLRDLDFKYEDAYLLGKTKNPYSESLAIIAPRTSDRLFAQKGLFTLQGSDSTPMNLNPKTKDCFKKFDIPTDAIEDAKKFLKLSGINHYSIYPDLDGLGRYLNEIHEME